MLQSSSNKMEEGKPDRLSCKDENYRSKDFPLFDKPKVVGEFTLDRARSIQLGRANVRYLYDQYLRSGQNLGLDLNPGFETFDMKDVHESLNILLNWIIRMSPPGANLKKVLHESSFVCYRGLLTRIGSMPFENNTGDGNKISCCAFKGVIFMCEFDTDLKKAKQETDSLRSKKMTYHGFKFEQCVTTDIPGVKPNVNEPVSTWNEFSVVCKSVFGPKEAGLGVLYCAEVDCITQKLGVGKFFGNKVMKWWLQSYLVNISKIYVGIKTEYNIVNNIREVTISELPKKYNQWRAEVCFNFIIKFLIHVRQLLSLQPEGTVLLAERQPSWDSVKFSMISPGMPSYQEYYLITDEFKHHFSPPQKRSRF